jgi:hypothetical protein
MRNSTIGDGASNPPEAVIPAQAGIHFRWIRI